MCKTKLWIGVLAIASLAGCDGKTIEEGLANARKQNAYTSQTCPARQPSAGRILDPEKPQSCFGVVMACNYCEYDEGGEFKRSGMEACGVCVGWDTP